MQAFLREVKGTKRKQHHAFLALLLIVQINVAGHVTSCLFMYQQITFYNHISL